MPFQRRNKHAARLTRIDAFSIRQRWANREETPVTQAELAREYLVSINTIRNCLNGSTFQEVTMPEAPDEAQLRLAKSQERLAALLTEDEPGPEYSPISERSAAEELTAGGRQMIEEFLRRRTSGAAQQEVNKQEQTNEDSSTESAPPAK